MLAVSTTTWWVIGWTIGAAVVVVAALLLLAVIALGRRIARQAGEIASALEGVRGHTAPIYDVARTNDALERIAQGLAAAREGRAGG